MFDFDDYIWGVGWLLGEEVWTPSSILVYVKPLLCELGCVSCVSPAVWSREHVACVDFVGAGVARPDCLHFLYFYCHNSVTNFIIVNLRGRVDFGGSWWSVVEHGGKWWSVVERCGLCTRLWRPVENYCLKFLCTYVDKFIVYFFHTHPVNSKLTLHYDRNTSIEIYHLIHFVPWLKNNEILIFNTLFFHSYKCSHFMQIYICYLLLKIISSWGRQCFSHGLLLFLFEIGCKSSLKYLLPEEENWYCTCVIYYASWYKLS